MTIGTCARNIDDCLAYRYCARLESLGIKKDTVDTCFFQLIGKTAKPTDSLLAQIRDCQKDTELIAALVEAALDNLTLMNNMTEQSGEFEKLYHLRQALFKTHHALWGSMIRAARLALPFTDIELAYRTKKIIEAQQALARACYTADRTAVIRSLCAHDRTLKEQYALQFDAPVIADINRLVGNIINTRPTLIVGDKGIAKTQIAKFVMALYGHDPIVISVKGDMMSDELIGKIKHDRKENTFVFQEGMLLTAMREGLPILLDEINFGDQAIIARLQDILLKKPGETVAVQEAGDSSLTIAPGFAVFATANEASLRYRHREVLDPAIRDRFDVIIRSYPDLESDPILDTPASLLRIALSSAVNAWGLPSKHLDLVMLESFTRLAHITQYLYAVPARDVAIDLGEDRATSMVLEDSQPLMTDCITPRTLSNLIKDCSAGNLPDLRLDASLIEKSIRALDQAGSTHNHELAQQAKLLLDISNNPSGLDEETRKILEQEQPPLQQTASTRKSPDPFEALSDQAYKALLEIGA